LSEKVIKEVIRFSNGGWKIIAEEVVDDSGGWKEYLISR